MCRFGESGKDKQEIPKRTRAAELRHLVMPDLLVMLNLFPQTQLPLPQTPVSSAISIQGRAAVAPTVTTCKE